MKFIDIHCHLNFSDFNKDRKEVIKRTLEGRVGLINIGADLKTSKESLGLAEKHKGIWASVGCHPHYVDEFNQKEFEELVKHPKVVAIGECGLDYSRIKNSELRIKNKQKEIFEKQIQLAVELNKPLMIHCRQAHDEVLEILNSKFVIHNSKLRGNVHFFSGKWRHAEQYLELGFTLSFTGLITYINDYDKIIKKLPFEKIMIETDAPFVAPIPYRGQRCEPLHVKEVAKRIAEIKEVSFEEAAKITTQNAIDFFALK